MKYVIFPLILASIMFVNCNRVNKKTTHINPKKVNKSDSIYLSKKLPIYTANKCWNNLLSAISKSNVSHHNPHRIFYGIRLKKQKDFLAIEIFIDRWHDSKELDYWGAVKINDDTFLLTGDHGNESLFERPTSAEMQINLSKTVTISDIPKPAIEPSLSGIIYSCSGFPIYVEIYTDSKIVGLKLNIKH